MDRLLPEKGQSCCLAVMPDLKTTGLACLELCLVHSLNLAVSVLYKPETKADCRDFIRVKSVGTITCRGWITRALKQRSVEYDDTRWEMSSILNLIGVPVHHVEIYKPALKSGLVVIVVQGQVNSVRQGCQILQHNSRAKPVLYLG